MIYQGIESLRPVTGIERVSTVERAESGLSDWEILRFLALGLVVILITVFLVRARWRKIQLRSRQSAREDFESRKRRILQVTDPQISDWLELDRLCRVYLSEQFAIPSATLSASEILERLSSLHPEMNLKPILLPGEAVRYSPSAIQNLTREEWLQASSAFEVLTAHQNAKL